MILLYTQEKKFDKIDFKKEPLPKGEYDNCHFSQCDFSETDLSEIKFNACNFNECNLSLVKLKETVFQDTTFKVCKMLGLRFDQCNRFGMSFRFEKCVLDHSYFCNTRIKRTVFKDCQLRETDFTDCDLSSGAFDLCDLSKTIFENSKLENVDFRTAFNISIDPEGNKIKKAKFSLSGLPGLLSKYDIEIYDAG